jgi:hypothetical protein
MGGEWGAWAATETWDSDAASRLLRERDEVPADEGETDVVQAVLSWCDTHAPAVLGVRQLRNGQALSLGEEGDFLVPEEVLGATRIEVARYHDGRAVAFAPAGARLRVDGRERDERSTEIASGHVVELILGAFAVQLARVSAGRCAAAAPLQELHRSGAGFIAGSALAHFAVFAAIAFFTPSLGAAEEDAYDADRLALMKHLLNAHAMPETDRSPDAASDQSSGGTNAGQPARGAEGEQGRPEVDRSRAGRWAARGSARPESATLARERELGAAAAWPTLGMLASLAPSDPSAPTVPWGTVLNGADTLNAAGRMFGRNIDDAFGAGGLGLSGLEEGGGGHSNTIGMSDIDVLGHAGAGSCEDGPCDGIGASRGRLGRPHVVRPLKLRYGEEAHVNGHLPAEVIQRIVRQNDGRYRFCYAKALKENPNLQGRVTVRFVIDRGGAVALAADGGSDIPDVGVRQCVVTAFQSLSFPAPDAGMVTVVYPLVFSPE